MFRRTTQNKQNKTNKTTTTTRPLVISMTCSISWGLVTLLCCLCHAAWVSAATSIPASVTRDTSAADVLRRYETPSDYLLGSQNKPRLGRSTHHSLTHSLIYIIISPKSEILHPANGEVLDSRDLKISVQARGYDLPSPMHDSVICVGLSTAADYSEQCFDQTDLTFHVNGLMAGTNYGLRVVLFGMFVASHLMVTFH
jgi:hypothetical protein